MTTDGTVQPRRAAIPLLLAVLAIAAAACGDEEAGPTGGTPTATSAPTTASTSDDDDPAESDDPAEGDDPADGDAGTVPTTTVGTTSSSTSTTPADGDATDDDRVATPDELRRWLGAEYLVVRRADAPALATSDDGELELVDPFPTVKAGYLFDGGALIDITGEAACPGFELLGDFHVIADIEPTPGDWPSIIVEDRRALATDAGSGAATVPRWRFDCATGTATDLDPTTAVLYLSEGQQVTKALASGLVLVETRGPGDTPLALATDAGTVLLQTDQLAYDYELSADQSTLYATAYADTGAASPPAAVLAIDVATGEIRWRRELGGFAWALGDQVLIEVVDPRPEAPGQSPGSEIVLVDPATGEDLDRIRFTDRIVGLS